MRTCYKDIEGLVRLLNHNAIIVMSVTGEKLTDSIKTATGIVSRFFWMVSIARFLNFLLVFWGFIIVTGITLRIGPFW